MRIHLARPAFKHITTQYWTSMSPAHILGYRISDKQSEMLRLAVLSQQDQMLRFLISALISCTLPANICSGMKFHSEDHRS